MKGSFYTDYRFQLHEGQRNIDRWRREFSVPFSWTNDGLRLASPIWWQCEREAQPQARRSGQSVLIKWWGDILANSRLRASMQRWQQGVLKALQGSAAGKSHQHNPQTLWCLKYRKEQPSSLIRLDASSQMRLDVPSSKWEIWTALPMGYLVFCF